MRNRKKQGSSFPCPAQETYFLWRPSASMNGHRRFPKGDRKALWSPPQRRNPLRNRKKQGSSFPCPAQETYFLRLLSASTGGHRRFPKGDRKALWSPPQRRNPLRNRKKKVKLLPLPCTRNLFLVSPIRFNGWAPKVSKGRSESPLVASAEAKPSAKQKKESKVPSLALYKKPISCGSHPLQRVVAEGFQRATGKPFGRLRRGEILCET